MFDTGRALCPLNGSAFELPRESWVSLQSCELCRDALPDGGTEGLNQRKVDLFDAFTTQELRPSSVESMVLVSRVVCNISQTRGLVSAEKVKEAT